jgi:hypothetical protein
LFLKAHLIIIDSFLDDLDLVRILDALDCDVVMSQKTASHLTAIMTRVISIVPGFSVVSIYSFSCRESGFRIKVAATSVRKILESFITYLLNTEHNIYGGVIPTRRKHFPKSQSSFELMFNFLKNHQSIWVFPKAYASNQGTLILSLTFELGLHEILLCGQCSVLVLPKQRHCTASTIS